MICCANQWCIHSTAWLTHVIVVITQQEGFFKTGLELLHNVLGSLFFTAGRRIEVSQSYVG